jgi:8-oxo-dGTP pyrophosphatase MutT (NUDIX family)
MSWRRNTARVLPVDPEGRVLLLHGWDPRRPEDPFWFTIGGGVEGDETLPEAAARELREEAGIWLDPALLGEPIDSSLTEFNWAGMHFVQDQTFFAVAVSADVAVSFDGQESLERATTDKHAWLFPSELEDGSADRPADPDLPRVMRLASSAVLGG